MVAGFTSVGVDVLLLARCRRPPSRCSPHSMRADVGVMISASHNPYEDNGIKLFGPDGYKLSDEVEAKIEAILDGEQPLKLSKSADLGRAMRVEGDRARYIEFAKRTLVGNASLEGLRVVVDCANGAAYKVAPEVLWELGAEVFTSATPRTGSTSTAMSARPRPRRSPPRCARCGPMSASRSDGDADRVIIVDERGKIVDGDQLMAAIAESWQQDGRLSRPGVVATLMSNLGFERYLSSIGLTLARTAVGDRYVLEHMREHGYNLGGEQSGHIILKDYCTTGDGLVAALQLLLDRQAAPKAGERCLPSIRAGACKFSRTSVSAPAAHLRKSAFPAPSKAGRRMLGANGRLVIRPSGTEPVIRVMGEGDDRDLVEKIVDDVCDALSAVAA